MLKPVILEVLSQPPKILGLPERALIPLSIVVGSYITLLMIGQVLSAFWDAPELLEVLNTLGWALTLPFVYGFCGVAGLSSERSSIVTGVIAVLGSFILARGLLSSPLGWVLSVGFSYLYLQAFVRKDIFALNAWLARFKTPPQQSHLFLKSQERRYV